jgi:hypothetical protein
MKLDRGNPNLMKKAALRVNPHNTLESFGNTTGDKAQAQVRRGYVPPVRDPNTTPAPAINIWKQSIYVPENNTPARRGAEDFLRYKSRGL